MVLSCDDVLTEPLAPAGAPIGIDMGIASFLTPSDGTHVPNPRHLATASERLAGAQRDLARKKRGGCRRKKAAARVARLHGKVRRQRLDYAHKTALVLVRDDLVVHENLKVANMIARPKPRSRVSQAKFRCLACGHQAHADVNAARNILRVGLALQET